MSRRLTKKSLVSWPTLPVRTPTFVLPVLAPSTLMPPTSTVISLLDSVSILDFSTSRASGERTPLRVRPPLPMWLRNPSAVGSRTAKLAASVSSAVVSPLPPAKGTVTSTPAALAADSMAADPARTMRSAIEMASAKSPLTFSRAERTPESSSGSLAAQEACGSRRTLAPLLPPLKSVPRNVEAEAQAALTSWEIEPACKAASLILARVSTSGAPAPNPNRVPLKAGTGSCQIWTSGTREPRNLFSGPMSRCVSLYHAFLKASANSCGFSWNLLLMGP
mmetsp:Transcript_24335/g.50531  ORF Transcript_24335/g.50531 Transcript_24335/m.50531 type:complete len:278 (+) Transcript_24335:310-1143(+)